MSNNRRKRKTPVVARISPTGAAAIVVMGIFVMCLVVLVSKALFVSNSKELPEGIDTATIGSQTQPSDPQSGAEATTTTAAASVTTTVAKTTTTETTTTTAVVKMKTLRITYLKEEPDDEAKNIVPMSVGIQVDVLETLENGWSKVTFLNVTGQLTGYILTSCLG
ncbi:SH3 domain-containing protein [Ruminococcus sp. FC2018]|uniref:SH3 domain-containing protein n=1 Tax=Ruminococcus sp. FC2018 TaxID=1410617 RepID=UPI000490569A|nr:SH3 domain-containing protein [Ruminococcus sp. FC2018]